ncbi:MAG TPA: hypothetical protein VFX49_06620, partial [Chloroflexota bacterium]|nr:hypothetical protein [Chloroflexota bacterium]
AGLVLANTIQNSAHAVILLAVLAARHADALPPGLAATVARIGVASALMATVCAIAQAIVATPASPLALAAYLAVTGALAGAAYVAALIALRGEEVALVRAGVLDRLRRRSAA